jgi:hypothetical protein
VAASPTGAPLCVQPCPLPGSGLSPCAAPRAEALLVTRPRSERGPAAFAGLERRPVSWPAMPWSVPRRPVGPASHVLVDADAVVPPASWTAHHRTDRLAICCMRACATGSGCWAPARPDAESLPPLHAAFTSAPAPLLDRGGPIVAGCGRVGQTAPAPAASSSWAPTSGCQRLPPGRRA